MWTDPRLVAWTALQAVAFPLLLAGKARRHASGYVSEFDGRRWKISGAPRRGGAPCVVFVGAGPGELVMIDRLMHELARLRPDVETSVCLRDLAALDRMQAARPQQRFCVWPFDHVVPVSRWLRAERPTAVVFVDRFRFTSFACGAARYDARLGLVNGRSRRRESLLYRLAAPYYRWQISGFNLLAMEDVESADAIRPLAATQAQVVALGSLKADLLRKPDSSAALIDWLRAAEDRPLVAAGSTVDLEEESFVIDAFLRLRARVDCRLLLAPRNPERAEVVVEYLLRKGLQISRRSREEAPADVMLLDTFGELRQVYGFSQAAYVGGFFGKGGGHNVMEPLAGGAPVAYGPGRGSFASLQRTAEARGVATRVSDAADLADFWAAFLLDRERRQGVSAEAIRLTEENAGSTERTVREIVKLLPLAVVEPKDKVLAENV